MGEFKRSSGGFGMLEVLVALVLITSVGVTIVAWVQGGVDSVLRLRSVYEQMHARQRVLVFSRTINPAEKPVGKAVLGGDRLEWTSDVLETPVPQTGYPSGRGYYDVGLYRLEIKVFHSDSSELWFQEALDVVGSRKVRSSSNPFAG